MIQISSKWCSILPTDMLQAFTDIHFIKPSLYSQKESTLKYMALIYTWKTLKIEDKQLNLCSPELTGGYGCCRLHSTHQMIGVLLNYTYFSAMSWVLLFINSVMGSGWDFIIKNYELEEQGGCRLPVSLTWLDGVGGERGMVWTQTRPTSACGLLLETLT